MMIRKNAPIRAILLLAFLPNLAFAQQLVTLTGDFNNCVFRPADGKLYASVSENNFTQHSLVRIDPNTRVKQKLLNTGDAWYQMEITADGSRMYGRGNEKILRYNFATGAIDQTFGPQLGAGLFDAVQILTLPNAPNSVVVLWQNIFTNYRTIAVYDNGVKRSNTLEDSYFGRLAISEDGSRLYVYNLFTTSSDVQQIVIGSNGVTKIPGLFHYMTAFSQKITLKGNRIFGSDGTVMSIAADGSLTQTARLNNPVGTVKPAFIHLETQSGAAKFAVIGNIQDRLFRQEFDDQNYQLLKTERIAVIPGATEIRRIIPLAEAGAYAVLDQYRLSIIRNCTSQIAAAPDLPQDIYYSCSNDTLRITAPGAYADDRYLWSDGKVGRTYKAYASPSLSLSYSIADDQGCFSAPCKPVSVSLQFATAAPYLICDAPVICQNGFTEIRVVPAFTSSLAGYTFHWSDGQTGQHIRVTSPGAYSCFALSPQGCKNGSSQTIQVSSSAAQQPPKPTVSIIGDDGDLVVCSGSNAMLATQDGYVDYYWSDQPDFHSSIRPFTQATTVSVQVVNSAGCRSEPSDLIDFKYVVTPVKPQIIRAGNVVASSQADGNQWFLNGSPITGATGQYLTLVQPGSYTVRVNNGFCDSPFSDPVQF